jgi:hypothetical protein
VLLFLFDAVTAVLLMLPPQPSDRSKKMQMRMTVF